MNTLIVLALFLVLLFLSWPTLLQLIAGLRLQNAGRPVRRDRIKWKDE